MKKATIKKLAMTMAIALTLSTALTACSSTEGESTMAQGVTDTEIIVANSAAVSGAFATTGDPINAGIQAYFDMINAQGGVDGRQITFIHQDDEYDPVKAKAAFQTFLEDEQVFAYVGHFGSSVVAATLDDIRESGIPVVYFATGIGELYVENATSFEEGSNCYPIQPLYISEGEVMIARAVGDFNATNIGIIYTNDDTGMDIQKGAESKCNELGVSVISEQVAATASDVSAAVTSIKNAGVDFIVIASAQATMPTIVKELAAQEVNTPAITTYLNTVITLAEQISDIVPSQFPLYATGWLNYEDERAVNLEEAAEWLGDYAMNGYAHCGWIGAHFFVEGLKRLEGQDITWEAYVEAMESAPISIPFGGEVDYSDGQRLGTQELSLFELNMDSPTGWAEIDGLRSIDELLA